MKQYGSNKKIIVYEKNKAYIFFINVISTHPRIISVSVTTLLLLITLMISVRLYLYSYTDDRRMAYLVGDAFSDRLELALTYALSAQDMGRMHATGRKNTSASGNRTSQ